MTSLTRYWSPSLSWKVEGLVRSLCAWLKRCLPTFHTRHLWNCFTVLICFSTMPVSSATPDIIVITSPGDNTPVIDLVTIANIYRRKIPVDKAGQVYIPVNLPATNPLRRAFSQLLFKQAPEEMEDYWNEQYFQGISPPFVLGSSEAVVRFVTLTRGAVGYVLDCGIEAPVKVILRLPLTGKKTGITDQDCPGPIPPD